MTQLLQAYSYLRPSGLHDSTTGRRPALETSGGATPTREAVNPRFFSGFRTAPAAAATALLAVTDVAAARCHRSGAGASLDPVVTADGDRLRLESISGRPRCPRPATEAEAAAGTQPAAHTPRSETAR